ncbi:nuclear speckle RNA-binding protein A-like isoform X1 [Brassica napus]|uniref:nuclear speckle RNA-binding protein A-like isoform X1 n=1 Tax=Brassica napus TaxID=3708 RepID=UPI000BBE2F59|nr:nuclear speckle RNA-binding protein A-like isoform X1 [Brassica napus]
MADGYWNQQRQHQPPMSSISHGGPPKRPRSDFVLQIMSIGFNALFYSGHDMHSYVSRDEDRGGAVKDTRTIGSAYDLYLQSVQTSSMPSEEVGRFNNGVGMGRRGGGMLPPDFGPNGRGLGFGQQDLVGRPSRELLRLPPDASNTLFVEGLPSNCSRREVSHIFRPFLGYKEVRLVTKDSKQRNGDPIVLCFVDFENPACAATARTALQGYRMDENEPDSKSLQIQFSRNPGPRPGQRGGRR